MALDRDRGGVIHHRHDPACVMKWLLFGAAVAYLIRYIYLIYTSKEDE